MPRLILLLFLLPVIFLHGCTSPKNEQYYTSLGQVSFRRNYTQFSKEWSEAEYDSTAKSNPDYMEDPGHPSDKAFSVLDSLDIADKDELFLDKLAQDLKDTITFENKSTGIDTIYLQYDLARTRASIWIRHAGVIDSIPIKDEPFAHTFSLVRFKNTSTPFIIFVNQWYIANGDNYDVSVYEINANKNIR